MTSRCAILTWYDPGFYFDGYFHEKNKAYCEKFGYDFIASSVRRLPALPLSWERIPLVEEHLSSYDYIMWLDADAHLLDKDIAELITRDAHLIIGEDASGMGEGTDHNIQAGVFMLENAPWSFEFLETWLQLGPEASNEYRVYAEGPGGTKRYKYFDQGALRWMFVNNLMDIKNHSVVHPFGKLQHFTEESGYVLHYAGDGGKRRLEAHVRSLQ